MQDNVNNFVLAGPTARYDFVELLTSEEYSNAGAGGFHSLSDFRNNLVVTGDDSLATFTAALAVPLGNNGKVGIFPSDTTAQRLLFYLKVSQAQMCSAGAECSSGQLPDMYMRLAFNHKVILIPDANLPAGIELSHSCMTGP